MQDERATIADRQTNDVPTVYVVDPDHERRDHLRTLLGELDCRVREFSSAESFLTELDRDTTGCVVLDWQPPGSGELELLERLKRGDARLPVIVLAGEGNVSGAVTAMRAGAATIVERPYVPGVLLREIRRFLES